MTKPRSKINVKNVLVTPLLVLLASAISYGLAIKLNQHEPLFNETIVKYANKNNLTCPAQVDDQTQLDNAMALPGRTIRFNYTLFNYTRENIDTLKFQKSLRPIIVGKVKQMSEMAELRSINASIIYYYKDRQGGYVCQVIIEPGDYK